MANRKSAFVRAVFRTSIDGKMYALTEYYTWIYESPEWKENQIESEDPLERMKQCSKIMVLHQDEYSIQETLEDIAKIFATAVSWNRDTQTLSELTDSMALFCHRATHNIRDLRGTAAENEWLEQAIFLALKVVCITNPERMIDLEAFIHPLFSEFREIYKMKTKLSL